MPYRRDVTDAVRGDDDGCTAIAAQLVTHEKADMAIVWAAYTDYAAWRNTEDGSYFIQVFCDVMRQRAHKEDFKDIVTQVTSKMDEMNIAGRYKQICKLETTLKKNLYLFPY